MRKLWFLLAAGMACGLTLAALSMAAPRTSIWTAALTSGQEVPKQVVKNASAHGQFKATVSGKDLEWTLTFSKLTGQATAAHIHLAPMGRSGAVVVGLCSPCRSSQAGLTPLTSTLMDAFKKHRLYVNVYTAKNPGGEIRGQIAAG